ncbi:13407_t:CDS:2, partial [Gigaspora margarita]
TVLQNKDAPASDKPNNVSASDISDRGEALLLRNNALNSSVCQEETKSRVSNIPLTQYSASPIHTKPVSLEYKEKKLRDRGLIQKTPSSENPATEISVLQNLPKTKVSIPAKVDVLTKSQVTNTYPKLYPLKKMLSKEKHKEVINKLTMHFTDSPKVDLYCSVDKEGEHQTDTYWVFGSHCPLCRENHMSLKGTRSLSRKFQINSGVKDSILHIAYFLE